MNDKIKISASSIQTLEQCPRKWFLRYIRKLYPEVGEKDATEFGSFVHDVAEHYNGDGLEQMTKIAKEALGKYKFNRDYKNKVKTAIKNLYIFYTKRFKNGELEKEQKYECHYRDNFFLTGKLDVLYFEEEGKVYILDWKTSKAEKDHSFQLAFYVFLLNFMKRINLKTVDCEVVYLCPDKNDMELYVSPYTIDQDDVKSAVARFENLITQYKCLGVEDIEKWRKKTGPLCNWCDYYKSGDCTGKEPCHG